jgi:antitoxin ChpS
MLTASLRRSGGSLIVTVPQSYVEQNHLAAGARLVVEIVGTELCLRPLHARRRLAEILATTPEGLHRVDGWDELPSVGAEQ